MAVRFNPFLLILCQNGAGHCEFFRRWRVWLGLCGEYRSVASTFPCGRGSKWRKKISGEVVER